MYYISDDVYTYYIVVMSIYSFHQRNYDPHHIFVLLFFFSLSMTSYVLYLIQSKQMNYLAPTRFIHSSSLRVLFDKFFCVFVLFIYFFFCTIEIVFFFSVNILSLHTFAFIIIYKSPTLIFFLLVGNHLS